MPSSQAVMSVLVTTLAFGSTMAAAPPVEKTPIAFGSWKGPSAGSFKSALRRGLQKECVVVPAKKARAIITAEVTQEGKKYSVHVVVTSTKTNEVVESRTFTFSKPSLSAGQTNKFGADVGAIARRSPLE
jgi:hypothetical protein